MPENSQDPREMGYYFALAQVGLEMVVPIGLGWWLDQVFGWFPWGTVIGTLAGLLLGFTHLMVLTNWHQRESPRGKKDS